MPEARRHAAGLGMPREQLMFIDDAPTAPVVNGHRVVPYEHFLGLDAADRFVAVAVADGAVRRRLVDRCIADGVQQWNIIGANVVIMDEVHLGPGAILSPFVTIGSNVRIGRSFHGNLYSYVEHDCVIGDFVTFAPGVKCNGNVLVEDNAYVGSGAIIKQGRPGDPLVIGEGAVIGMGAVVTKSVPSGDTVAGNPARPLRRTRP